MEKSSKNEKKYVISEDNYQVTLKFRKPTSTFLRTDMNPAGSAMKLIPDKIITIAKKSFPILSMDKFSNKVPFDALESIEKEYEEMHVPKIKNVSFKKIKQNELVRKIILARDLIRKKLMPKIIAMYTGLKISKVYSLKKKVESKQPLPIYKKKIWGKKLKREHFSYFVDIMKIPKFNMMTMKELRDHFLKRFNLDSNFITVSGLRKALKNKIKLTWKKISPYKKAQIEETNKMKRKEYSDKIIPIFYTKMNIVFLDESSFNFNMHKDKGWNLASKKIYMEKVEKSCNYSLLAAITKEKLVGLMISRGSIVTESFAYFLDSLVNRFLEENVLANTIILVDGSKVHVNPFIARIFNKKVRIVILPPYSPELNPIEICWTKLKREVRRGGKILSEDDLIFKIFQSSQKINEKDCKGWFRHSIRFLKKSFLMENFYT